MTRNELIDALADYYCLDDVDTNTYDWNSGCSFGKSGNWLTLNEIIQALEEAGLVEEDEDYDED